MPIIIHNRDAHEDTMEIVKKEEAGKVGGVFHCYSGSVEMAKLILNMNFYISVGGAVTFKNARRLLEVVSYVPLDRLLIETDCPYMTPEPHRGKRNYSGYLPYVVAKIAEIKGVEPERIENETYDNACRLFSKTKFT
jgi:TatD DNase family protein